MAQRDKEGEQKQVQSRAVGRWLNSAIFLQDWRRFGNAVVSAPREKGGERGGKECEWLMLAKHEISLCEGKSASWEQKSR